MRTIIAAAFMTLDGVVQDPGGFGETGHGGWAQRYFDGEASEQATKAVQASDIFLLGRRTGRIMPRVSRSPAATCPA